jgi:hypothetical protein
MIYELELTGISNIMRERVEMGRTLLSLSVVVLPTHTHAEVQGVQESKPRPAL